MDALYVIGEPGVGKSELIEELTAYAAAEELAEPFAHRIYECGVIELGRRREEFSGTDSLSMAVQPKVMEWLETAKPAMLLAEGDRLANDGFFKRLVELGYSLRIVQLVGPGVAARRRLHRGSKQDPKWLSGRQGKVRRLAVAWAPYVQQLDARWPAADLAELVDSPVARALRGKEVAGDAVQRAPATQQDLGGGSEADAGQDRDGE
jgi:P-loop Nucleotide Kinase3